MKEASALLDVDMVVMVITAPIWMTYFAVLIVEGLLNDHGWLK